MGLRRLVWYVLIGALVLLVAACEDEDLASSVSPSASPALTPSAPTPIDGEDGVGASPIPTPTDDRPPVRLDANGLPLDAAGPLLVYASAARLNDFTGLPTSTRISTYDVGTSRTLAEFEVGDLRTFVLGLQLVGSQVVVETNRTVEIRALNGEPVRTLLELSDGDPDAAGAFTISPDGRLLAMAVPPSRTPPDPFRTDIRVIEVDTGHTILEVPFDHPGLEGEGVWLRPSTWRDDGGGFVVEVSTGFESGPRLATVRLDGSVHLHPASGSFALVAPNGRLAAVGPDSLGCMFISGHRIALLDLDTDTEVASYEDPELALLIRSWSPDSREVLFEARALPADPAIFEECRWPLADPELLVFGVNTPALEFATHLEAFERWQPGGGVTYVCVGVESGVGASGLRMGPLNDRCDVEGLERELRYRGATIATARGVTAIGLIDVER
ncbi:MAG: hypothetical protein R3C39_10100 [Dehalococcoidia bacterium]